MASATRKKDTRGPRLDHHQVVIRPLVTEKSTHLSTQSERRASKERSASQRDSKPIGNAYCFEVNRWADKDQIKHAVEELFGVRVLKVRTQTRIGKKRRYRFRVGQLPSWKKAIVTLHADDRIEFF